MRYICLVAILLALPLNAGAQQRRAAERRSDQNRSEQRRSDDRSNGRKSDERGPAAKPPAHASTLPWWEHQPPPWWERQQAPGWEQQRRTPPPFELSRIPGYSQGNVARAIIEQQRYGPNGNNPRRSSRHYRPSVAYVLPTYGYFSGSVASTTAYEVTPPASGVTVYAEPEEPALPPMGALRLEVEPKEALQIYVDSVYIGTPADLGEEIELAPGVRRIELRAAGYRSLTFSAEILDGRLITYRGTLDRDDAQPPAPRTVAPAAAAATNGRTVMYVIPGCYLGNVSPKNVALPAGCDISKLTTISP